MTDDQFWNKFSTKTPDYREGYMDGYKIGLSEGLRHHVNTVIECQNPNEPMVSEMEHKKNWLEIYAKESY